MSTDTAHTYAIGGHVTLRARAGHEQELAAVLLEARRAVRAEPGCIYYDVFRSRQDPQTFHLLEKYVDKTALKNHLAAPHSNALQSKLAALLDGEPIINLMTEVL